MSFLLAKVKIKKCVLLSIQMWKFDCGQNAQHCWKVSQLKDVRMYNFYYNVAYFYECRCVLLEILGAGQTTDWSQWLHLFLLWHSIQRSECFLWCFKLFINLWQEIRMTLLRNGAMYHKSSAASMLCFIVCPTQRSGELEKTYSTNSATLTFPFFVRQMSSLIPTAQSWGHHTINCLEEVGIETSAQWSSRGWKRVIVRPTLELFQRQHWEFFSFSFGDGVELMWAFLSL